MAPVLLGAVDVGVDEAKVHEHLIGGRPMHMITGLRASTRLPGETGCKARSRDYATEGAIPSKLSHAD